jgi:hypothetical protein
MEPTYLARIALSTRPSGGVIYCSTAILAVTVHGRDTRLTANPLGDPPASRGEGGGHAPPGEGILPAIAIRRVGGAVSRKAPGFAIRVNPAIIVSSCAFSCILSVKLPKMSDQLSKMYDEFW